MPPTSDVESNSAVRPGEFIILLTAIVDDDEVY